MMATPIFLDCHSSTWNSNSGSQQFFFNLPDLLKISDFVKNGLILNFFNTFPRFRGHESFFLFFFILGALSFYAKNNFLNLIFIQNSIYLVVSTSGFSLVCVLFCTVEVSFIGCLSFVRQLHLDSLKKWMVFDQV